MKINLKQLKDIIQRHLRYFFFKFQQLRLLKTLTITHSNIPNIGRRTMWGLSGLKTLNLSHNKLTNVIDQNFEGTLKFTC